MGQPYLPQGIRCETLENVPDANYKLTGWFYDTTRFEDIWPRQKFDIVRVDVQQEIELPKATFCYIYLKDKEGARPRGALGNRPKETGPSLRFPEIQGSSREVSTEQKVYLKPREVWGTASNERRPLKAVNPLPLMKPVSLEGTASASVTCGPEAVKLPCLKKPGRHKNTAPAPEQRFLERRVAWGSKPELVKNRSLDTLPHLPSILK